MSEVSAKKRAGALAAWAITIPLGLEPAAYASGLVIDNRQTPGIAPPMSGGSPEDEPVGVLVAEQMARRATSVTTSTYSNGFVWVTARGPEGPLYACVSGHPDGGEPDFVALAAYPPTG